MQVQGLRVQGIAGGGSLAAGPAGKRQEIHLSRHPGSAGSSL